MLSSYPVSCQDKSENSETSFVESELGAMQLLNRLLVVLFFGLFGTTALLIAYSSHVAQQSGRVSVEQGNDFLASWIFLIFVVLFGIALCLLSIYCLFKPQPISFK